MPEENDPDLIAPEGGMPDASGPGDGTAPETPTGSRARAFLDPSWWDAPHIGVAAIVVGVFIAVTIIGVRSCGTSGPAYSHPATRVVSEALSLRRDRSTDAKAYAALFESSAVATELAAVSEAATTSPIPDWETPYVSEVSTSSADVVVIWVRDPAKPDFPSSVVFTTRLGEKGWRIADAQNTTDTPPPPIGTP